MFNHIKRKFAATGMMCLMLMATGTTAYGAVPAPQTSTVQEVQNQGEDPTLGGLFELYTPEEYEESINQIKKYMGADHADVKAMEAELEKLKADNGKGEFVIYKGAFTVSTETTVVAFNPTIVMRPDLAKNVEELTAENYKKDIEEVTKLLDQAVKDKTVTLEQKDSILKKMNENLAKLS